MISEREQRIAALQIIADDSPYNVLDDLSSAWDEKAVRQALVRMNANVSFLAKSMIALLKDEQ